MSEKAISIGHYFVASGVYTLFGTTFPTDYASMAEINLDDTVTERVGAEFLAVEIQNPHETTRFDAELLQVRHNPGS